MGQYYNAYVIGNRFTRIYCPFNADEGAKLLDSGIIGSKTEQAVLNDITDAPKHVAWIGDYALDQNENEPTREIARRILTACSRIEETSDITPTSEKSLAEYIGYYLFNHTKKQLINLAEYIRKNARVYMPNTAEFVTYCYSPLALLTACGNSLGGYQGRDVDLVGSWAGDLIEFKKCGLHPEFRDSNWSNRYRAILPEFVANYTK